MATDTLAMVNDSSESEFGPIKFARTSWRETFLKFNSSADSASLAGNFG